jgi:hypothetical protein
VRADEAIGRLTNHRIFIQTRGVRSGVMNVPKATSALSPFDSQLRTLVGATRRSHSCQLLTHALQQTTRMG